MTEITPDIVEELELEVESVICSKETSLQTLFSLAESLHLPEDSLQNKSRLAVSRMVRECISHNLEENKGEIDAQHEFLTGVLDILMLSEKGDPRDPTGGREGLQEESDDVVADNLGLGEANNSPDNEILRLQAQSDRLKVLLTKMQEKEL